MCTAGGLNYEVRYRLLDMWDLNALKERWRKKKK